MLGFCSVHYFEEYLKYIYFIIATSFVTIVDKVLLAFSSTGVADGSGEREGVMLASFESVV